MYFYWQIILVLFLRVIFIKFTTIYAHNWKNYEKKYYFLVSFYRHIIIIISSIIIICYFKCNLPQIYMNLCKKKQKKKHLNS